MASHAYYSRFLMRYCNETAVGNYGVTYCFRLLNANEISCIRTDLFKDLTSLTLLSLYDNNIRSLANGTFANLRSIKTLFVSLAEVISIKFPVDVFPFTIQFAIYMLTKNLS